ncbi:MAG TPA: ABC transporter ATP-binding protein [Gemmatimonadaceae bacterium]
MGAPSSLLEIRDLHVAYGDLPVLRGVNLHVDAGELVSLLGGNGSGKSTTLKAILGLVKPRRGEIGFDGARVEGLATPALVRRGLTLVPEARRIFPFMTVRENLQMGSWVRRHDRAAVTADLERVLALFPLLRERLGQAGGTLSGGEQQMLAMARALMLRPKLMLMDEPSMGLAPAAVQSVFELIRAINREGVGILMVEQNATAALQFTHRAYVLEQGVMAIEGPSKDLLRHERVRTAYLGQFADPTRPASPATPA